MHHTDIDPSLCSEPLLESLDDGFSPPAPQPAMDAGSRKPELPAEQGLGPKSDF